MNHKMISFLEREESKNKRQTNRKSKSQYLRNSRYTIMLVQYKSVCLNTKVVISVR